MSVILNSSRRDDTLECLTSLAQSTYPAHRAIVVDNRSTDGSVEAIRARFPDARIIALEENRGYAGNNNVGIEAALIDGADWVFVLNEDTVLAPDCLSSLVAAGESDPRIGIVGPMVYHHDEPDVIQSAGGVLTAGWGSAHLGQDERDVGRFCEPRGVDWVSGCAILVRRQVIEQVGMLDVRFFIYFEETEWCIRATKGGWRIVHVPGAKVWHKGVQRDYRPKPSVTYYFTRNRLLLLASHGAPASVRLVAWAQTLRTLTSWTLRPKWLGMRDHRRAMWRGLVDYAASRWGPMPGPAPGAASRAPTEAV